MEEHLNKIAYVIIAGICIGLLVKFVATPIYNKIQDGGSQIENMDYGAGNSAGGNSSGGNSDYGVN